MMLRVVITSGPAADAVFELKPQTATTIGRGDDCDIRLEDPRTSRIHCRIEVAGGRALLEDAGSSWGTFVNGEKVEQRPLQPGDVIRLGETELRFEIVSNPAAVTWGPSSGDPQANADAAPSSPSASSLHDPAGLVGRTLHRYRID
ncbi:MAG: FHA domain-containing protein, partial [Planctomycetes bacterium]|nr:FHA domain-containing protein [Planctomycetota bacterium]